MHISRIIKLTIFFISLISWALVSQAEIQNSSQTASAQPPLLANDLANTPLVIPSPPDLNTRGYVLMDAYSGQILASKNMDQRMAPASLTKMMTLYIISSALTNHQISFDTLIPISKKAWQTGGSKMFIKAGEQIPVRELIQGIIVDSGNDATVAMAEFLAGSTDVFAQLMNAQAQKLGMTNTHYSDPTGLPRPDHYSSPHDIAILAQSLIRDFPQFYAWYKQKYFTYNHITQANRNHLLWRDPSVDGIKTGFTDDAGYCLVSSALRNGTRLISVIMGAPTNHDRYDYSQQMLNYGFRFYHSNVIYKANIPITEARVWYGSPSKISVGVPQDLSFISAIGQVQTYKTSIQLNKDIQAPVKIAQVVGQISVIQNGRIIAKQPLLTLNESHKAGFVKRLIDSIFHLFHKG